MTEMNVVLAAPERKRILRELLAAPEPWSATHRNLYREMIQAEFEHLTRFAFQDMLAEEIEMRVFTTLVLEGASESQARHVARESSEQRFREETEGTKERVRRLTFRQAVTANDGALAVTTGLTQACIICGGPFFAKSRRQHRSDSAYCSDACRQAAYRRRRSRTTAGAASTASHGA